MCGLLGTSKHLYDIQNTACRTGNWNSSGRVTLCDSCIQFCFSVHQRCRLSLCCIVKGNRNIGHRSDDIPRFFKCCCTIRAGTGRTASMAIS
ncbi:hypothetical protein TNCV_4826491 [Trichonephila clavipes]|nr:hypothetical protein TNCV_4826491 [Trichonephila clavipes]